MTDSVWLDLGYPARRDASGRLYKPLFAFMVIGLNGRIPLNTAGNLAAAGGGRLRSADRRHADDAADSMLRRAQPRRRTWATRSARSTRRMRFRTRFDPANQ